MFLTNRAGRGGAGTEQGGTGQGGAERGSARRRVERCGYTCRSQVRREEEREGRKVERCGVEVDRKREDTRREEAGGEGRRKNKLQRWCQESREMGQTKKEGDKDGFRAKQHKATEKYRELR